MNLSLPTVITLLQLCWQYYHDVTVSAFSVHCPCITSSTSFPIHRHQNHYVPLPQQRLGLAALPSVRTPPFSKTPIYATKEKTEECVSRSDTVANSISASAATSSTSSSTGCRSGSEKSSASTPQAKNNGQRTLLSCTKSNILSTIDSIVEAQQRVKCVKTKPHPKGKTKTRDLSSTSNSSTKANENIVPTQPSMGILGEKAVAEASVLTSNPSTSYNEGSIPSSRIAGAKLHNVSIDKIPIQNDASETVATGLSAAVPAILPKTAATEPGSILIPQRAVLSRTSLIFKNRLKDHISISVARESNDAEIANLRLSVFSDYSMDQRKEWIDKSCEVIRTRRSKGATCLAASINYIDDTHISSDDYGVDEDEDDELIDEKSFKSTSDRSSNRMKYLETRNWIIGSIECSAHEFHDSALGMRRPAGSILYITEVAVSPRTRRSGAGELLLKGMDKLARRRKVETLYLHVDVTNHAACRLYKKAGYEILDSKNELYSQFTTKLNLHDGATKGRRHHLMHKKLTKTQTWYSLPNRNRSASSSSLRGTLGFEIFDS